MSAARQWELPPRQPQTSYHQLKPSRARCSKPSRVTLMSVLKGHGYASGEFVWVLEQVQGQVLQLRCWASLVTLLCAWSTQEGHSPRHRSAVRRQFTPSHTAEIMSAISCAPAILGSSWGSLEFPFCVWTPRHGCCHQQIIGKLGPNFKL